MKLTPKTVMSLVVYRSLIVAVVLILSTLFLYLKFDRSVKLPLLSKNRPQGQAWEPLRFGKDGTFQISVFEDLHYGEGKPPKTGNSPLWAFLRLTALIISGESRMGTLAGYEL